MPGRNETTTKFRVDISELKKGIQDANRQIKLANAEFRAASSGMDNWAGSADGISAKLHSLEKVLGSQKTILASYEKQLELIVTEYGENSKEADEMRIKIANQQTAINKTTSEIGKYTKKLNDLEEEERQAATAADKQGSAYDDLKSKIDAQERELDDLKQKYKETVIAEGENSASAKKLAGQIRNLSGDLKSSKTAMNKADEAADKLDGSFGEAEQGAASFGDVLKANILSDFVREGFGLLKQAVQELAGAMRDAVVDAAAYGDEILTLASQTGLSTDSLQEFYYMTDLIDVPVETVTGAMAKLIRNMNSAREGTGSAAEAFDLLGISITDANGELRSNQDVFYEAIDALGTMTNETERDATAMALFGRSAQDLNPLIEQGSEGLEAFRQEAHDMGYVLDNESLEALGGVQDAFDRIHGSADAIRNQLVVALAPVIEDIAAAFQEWASNVDWDVVAQKLGEIATAAGEVIGWVIDHKDIVIGALAAITAAIVAMTVAQWAMNVAMNANPVGLIITLIGLLVGAFIALEAKTHMFRDFFIGAWEQIKEVVGGIVEGIKTFFTKAAEVISTVWGAIVGFFQGVWDGIKRVFGTVKDFFVGIFQGAIDRVISIWSGITGFFRGVWEGIKGIFSNVGGFFRRVFDGAKSIITTIIGAITGVIKAPINGIIRGINLFIGALNRIQIPDWVPVIGGRGIHINEIPLLASGGVLKRGQVGLLEGNGAEAVVPLENNKRWIAATARDLRVALQRDGVIGAGSGGSSEIVNNYNFTQNNTSPKPLSRLEIYRQSKNLFDFAVGGA